MRNIPFLVIAILMFSIFTVVTASASTFSCNDVTEIPTGECSELVSLYDASNGNIWTNNTNWKITNTPSDWYGVTVADGHVTAISLSGNNLSGRIPENFGYFLSNLIVFNLSNNHLGFDLYLAFNHLTSLTELILDYNYINGNLPLGLSDLSNLEILTLSHNQFTGSIPSELGNLTNLTVLDLSLQFFTGSIPATLGNLTNLNYLNLSATDLSGNLPSEFGNLITLDELIINDLPELTGPLPSSLTNLTLTTFYFDETDLCEPIDPAFQAWLNSIPDLRRTGILCSLEFSCSYVVEIPQLECDALVAIYNNTNGPEWTNNENWLLNIVPSTWHGIDIMAGHVIKISLINNNLVGSLPQEIGNLLYLQWIFLQNNPIYGQIPVELGYLTQLTHLYLNNNQFAGSIPPVIGDLSLLEQLDLSANQLSGGLPTELGNLGNIQYLKVSNNHLSGSIPIEIGNLQSLNNLFLNNNELTGDIPGQFINLTSLVDNMLDLDYNMLNVPIDYPNPDNPLHVFLFRKDPNWHVRQYSHFEDCANVDEITITECEALVALYNSTNGSEWIFNTNWLWTNTPSEWYGVTVYFGHVTQLALGFNNLVGTLPGALGNLYFLSNLHLENNALNSSIPPTVGNLIYLTELHLENNELSSGIPPESGNMVSLTYLNLSGNQLSNSIPTEVGNLVNLTELFLNNNQLSGNIPGTLGGLSNLTSLLLNQNLLTGSISSNLGNMVNLTVFDISNNFLNGIIPSEIGALENLGYLNLSKNQFRGNIPNELGNIPSLNYLYLYNNELTGDIPETFINLTFLIDGGLDLDYNMLNIPIDYPNPYKPLHVFLFQKDPEWHLRQMPPVIYYYNFIPAILR